MDLNPGEIVERYEVECELGEGGMAVVYRVRHTRLDTLHALKILTVQKRAVQQRLVREGKVQAGLRHPNVAAVTDVLEVAGSPALLMEYIDGPSLDKWIDDHKPRLDAAEEIFAGILAGVSVAHELGIVHRDLKPGNVLMAPHPSGEGWIPKVTDFGLAKALEGDKGVLQTRTGLPMGTPAYMSPEQVRDAKNVDTRTDIFALGCILYELACGQRPFDGKDTWEVFNAVAQGIYTPPRVLKADLPERVANAISGCLVTDMEARIPSRCWGESVCGPFPREGAGR